jgi:outer membrane lipoprotein-sorting protein
VTRAYLILALASLARADSLPEVLARMDAAAKEFRSLSATVHKTDYSATFDETTSEDATFKMIKAPKTPFVLLAEFTGRDPRKMRISGTQVQIYHPKANSVDIYDTQKYTKSADSLIMVGFGTSKADLLKDYDVALGGSETVLNTKATRIELMPKSEQRKKLLTKIQLWIPENKGNPIQEKILTGKEGKDYTLLQFSNEQILTAPAQLHPADFELNLPPDVKRFKAGK